MRILRAGFGGAATFLLFWYLFNEWVGGVGIAFIRGLGWPVSTAWLVGSVGMFVGLLRFARDRRVQEQQTVAAIATAAELGLKYTQTVERPTSVLPCFKTWYSGKNGNTGMIGGVPVSIFDMTQCIDTGEGNDYPSRTIVLLPGSGLLAVSVTPRGWFGRGFANVFGGTGITFDPATASADDQHTIREFSRAFRVDFVEYHTPTNEPIDSSEASERIIRRTFTPTLMASLLEHSGWSLETDGEWLACWKGNEVHPANTRLEMMTTAGQLRAALLAATANSPAA